MGINRICKKRYLVFLFFLSEQQSHKLKQAAMTSPNGEHPRKKTATVAPPLPFPSGHYSR